jgi:putative tricarboxylic transport membrane protein
MENSLDLFGTVVNNVLSWQILLTIVGGIIYGILAGAIPGISASIAVALLVPFTYTLDAAQAMILLTTVYMSSSYGGSITAILVNTPGTPGSVVTTFDGYPLTQQGKPGLALGTSIISSTIGGILGTIILIIFSVPIAKFALSFGPPEYFALAILGLTIISSLSSDNLIKGLIATLLGLLLTTVGVDPFTGFPRFTFGLSDLGDGFSFIPALIGLFAIGEVLSQVETFVSKPKKVGAYSKNFPTFSMMKKMGGVIFKSSIIGTIIGAIPGAGGTVATFIAYDNAKKSSKNPDQFGKGSLEGVAAPEAANNAAVGGALIPLLTLGIPGSASTAVLIGALFMHGLVPGPELFTKHIDVVYILFVALIIANIFMLLIGWFGNKIFVKVISIPPAILLAIIPAFAVVGSYTISRSMFDVGACLAFGVLGWQLKRNDFPTAPVVLGLILGFMVEANLRRTLIMGDYTLLFTRPLAAIMLVLALVSFVYPFIKKKETS